MRLQPRAVVDALLPDSWRGEGLVLRPLTAGDILFLEKLGSAVFADVDDCPATDITLAAYLLSNPSGVIEAQWAEGQNVWVQAVFWANTKCRLSAKQVRNILRGLLAEAFDSVAQTRWPNTNEGQNITELLQDNGMVEPVQNRNGNGLGWLLTVVDMLCSNYGWTMEAALKLPLATAFALLTARKINSGAEFAEPDFYEREQMDAIAKELGITI